MGERQGGKIDWRRRNETFGQEPTWPNDRMAYSIGRGDQYDQNQKTTPRTEGYTRSHDYGSNSSNWRSGATSGYYTPSNGGDGRFGSTASTYSGSSRYYSTYENGSSLHGGSYGYERRPYRPREDYSDYGSSSRSNAGTSIAGSTRSHTTKSGSSSKRRASYLRSNVRKSYHQGTFEVPKNYSADRDPPEPLPLLVLDLNGTLVCRDAYSGFNSSDRSKRPVARPYMKSFLQYCLGISSPDRSDEDPRDMWDAWEADRQVSTRKDAPHGSHFWQGEGEPRSKSGATFRLLLWSSAQPHNVDSMAKSILSPEQAEQLLRVYARDTLVTRRLYQQKAPSVKDLEILWSVLNSRHVGPEAEARLFAEMRDAEDKENPDEDSDGDEIKGGGAGHDAASRAFDRVIMPQQRMDATFEKGRGYGQHNTILLDDSIDKARLQPFNHVLVGEFDRAAALKVNNAREKHRRESSMEGESEDEVDDVLLQMIGVLEHARYQVNISSWIRFGGLGDFAGKKYDHPYYNEDENEDNEIDSHLVEEAIQYFSKPESPEKVNRPRLRTPIDDRSEAFWKEEGKKALSRNGIPLLKF